MSGIQIVVGIIAFSAMQAPARPQFTRPANEAEEITLALSAAPESLRAGAGVYVLAKSGYVKARDSSNGITCLVERSLPDTQEPICWDAEGAKTIMPVALARAEWRAQGIDDAGIKQRIDDGFASGRFRAPARAGVAYMLSPANDVFNGRSVIQYQGHLMIYAPYVTNAMICADMKDPYQPWVLNEGSPHAYIIVIPGSKR